MSGEESETEDTLCLTTQRLMRLDTMLTRRAFVLQPPTISGTSPPLSTATPYEHKRFVVALSTSSQEHFILIITPSKKGKSAGKARRKNEIIFTAALRKPTECQITLLNWIENFSSPLLQLCQASSEFLLHSMVFYSLIIKYRNINLFDNLYRSQASDKVTTSQTLKVALMGLNPTLWRVTLKRRFSRCTN